MGFILSAAAAHSVASAGSILARPFSIVASKSNQPVRKIDGSPPRKQQPAQPSVAEVKRAIGVSDDSFGAPAGAPSSDSSSSSPFLRFLERETAAERKLRETAEWMVERTEANEQPDYNMRLLQRGPALPPTQPGQAGPKTLEIDWQRILLLVCLYILPLWILLLLIASGVLKLPFDLPYWNDLLS